MWDRCRGNNLVIHNTSKLTSIGGSAFKWSENSCFPSLVTLGAEAFKHDVKLPIVIIPYTCSIGSNAFYQTNGYELLGAPTFSPTSAPSISLYPTSVPQWCPVQEVGLYLMTQDVMFVPKERHWKFQRIRIIRNVRYVVAIPTPTTIWVRLLAPPVLLIPEPSQVVGFVVQLARIMNMEVMSV